MRPYSVDLRERIVAATKSGMSKEAIAERYQVSRASVYRYIALEQSGILKPQSPPGRPTKLDDKGCERLKAQVKDKPSLSLQEHADEYAKRYKKRLSFSGINGYFKRLGIRRKKDALPQRAQ
jgi:transposase